MADGFNSAFKVYMRIWAKELQDELYNIGLEFVWWKQNVCNL